jgi:hypothetical protein
MAPSASRASSPIPDFPDAQGWLALCGRWNRSSWRKPRVPRGDGDGLGQGDEVGD